MSLMDDLWKTETCWRRLVLIIKLHIDIVHVVGYNFFYRSATAYWAKASSLSRIHDHTQTHHLQ